MTDDRRKGDDRPLHHGVKVSLTLTPAESRPFRWLPRHGEPYCIGEWFSQHIVRFVAFIPVYIAIIVSLILIVQLAHPFGLGH